MGCASWSLYVPLKKNLRGTPLTVISKLCDYDNCFILTDKISDSDIRDIPKLLGPDDLQHLYYSPVLGLHKEAVERAEYDARHFESCEITARRVLGMWRQEKGSEATRGKVLQALEESGCRDARRQLEEKWNLKGRNLLKHMEICKD